MSRTRIPQRPSNDPSSRPPRRLPLFVERLEDRTVPAAVFWDGGGDGVNWGSAANWSNDLLPTAADDVTINAPPAVTVQVGSFVTATCHSLQSQNSLTLSGGPLTIAALSSINGTLTLTSPFSTLTANGDLTVTNLTHGNGTVTGPANVTITGAWTWTGGTQTGTGRTVNAGTASLSGGFFSRLDGRTVDNQGTATITNNSITFANNAVWNNLAGSVFVLTGTGSIGNFFPGPLAGFNNAGLVRKTGAGASSIGIAFNSTGTVDVQAGSLTLGAGGTSSGSFTLAAGTVLGVGGTYNLQAGAAVTGPGVVQVSTFNALNVLGSATIQNLTLAGGTVTATGGLAVQNLSLNGGNLTGPGTVTVNGQLTWTSGNMSGTGRTVLNGPSAISGGFFSMLDGRTVDNAGTATVAPNDSITFANAAVWNNLAGSTFVLQGTGSVGNFFAGAAQFNNAGTLRKTGVAGASTVGVALNNTGTVEVAVGTLNLTTGSSSGTFNLAGGTVLNAGGPHTLNAGATATGPGTVQVATFNSLTVAGSASVQNLTLAGGTVTANAGLAVQNLALNGTLTGTGTVTVNGAFTWTNGTMTGTGRTVLNGTSSLAGGFFSMLDGRTVDNAGTASLVNNSITFRNNAVWNNLAAGTVVFDGNSSFGNFFATGQVNNAGLLRKTGPAGTTASVGIPVNNTGTIQVDTGTLSLSALTNFSGSTLSGGTYLLAGSSFLKITGRAGSL